MPLTLTRLPDVVASVATTVAVRSALARCWPGMPMIPTVSPGFGVVGAGSK